MGWMTLSLYSTESLSNNDGNVTKTSLKNEAASNFIARIPSRSIREMFANFCGVEFLETVTKFRKRKEKSSSWVHVLHKT